MKQTNRIFRVWDVHLKKYVSSVPTGLDNPQIQMRMDGALCISTEYSFDVLSEERYLVEVCTGLLDENENLLFEGDVIHYTCGRESIDCMMTVKWDDEQGRFTFDHPKYGFDPGDDWYGAYKIAGNVRENPELLK